MAKGGNFQSVISAERNTVRESKYASYLASIGSSVVPRGLSAQDDVQMYLCQLCALPSFYLDTNLSFPFPSRDTTKFRIGKPW